MDSKTMIVGLTGQTGAGKTSVSDYLRKKGHHVIDADLVAREVVAKGSKCLMDLVIAFGVDILRPDGTLNRRKLGDMVFADKSKRKVLNRITFPYIQEEIFARVEELGRQGAGIVFLDAPTLIESGTHQRCHKVISVIAPSELRMDRILKRDDITLQQGLIRMGAQHQDEYYTSKSDYVLTNDKGLGELFRRVDEVIAALEALSGQKENAR